MPFFLDTQETSQRFGNHIAEFRSLLDTNHISHGAPDDLFDFAKRLETSNQFRNDLSALVKSVVQKDSSQILLTDMMSIIAATVGGPSFADAHFDLTGPTNSLMEFLLGTGCWKKFGSPSPSASPAAPPMPRSSIRSEEPASFRVSPPILPSTAIGKEPENPADLIHTSSELRQMLTRLEINTLQVKLHLESIEQRINKMPVSSEAPSTPISPQLENPEPEPLLYSRPVVEKPMAEKIDSQIPAVPLFASESTSRRAIFSHDPEPRQPEADDFSSPTFAFAAEGERNVTPIGVFLAIVALVVVALILAHTGPGKDFVNAGMSRLRTAVPSLFGPAPAPDNAVSTAAPSPNSPGASASNPAALASAVPPARGQDGKIAASGTAPSTTSSGSSTAEDSRFTSDNPQIKYVQSNVMEGNLLSAPKPEYPPAARRDHIQGTVALQATISRSGSIRTLHVVNGPPALRSAAIEAVRHWHYKPYTVEGRPTEVATTIYVHFNPGPPPAIVR